MLGDATFSKLGNYEVLDENSTYSMLVWVPRYAYKITSMYHQSGSNAGTIEIVFLDTQNKTKDGEDYSSKMSYPNANTGTEMTDYVVHPSFNWDGVPLAGYWVGKFETSSNGGKVQIKGGVQSWRNINVSTIYNNCVGMNNSGNSYGLNTDDSKVDPHMMKNTEWGAPSRYKDIYSSYQESVLVECYGDAVYETSSSSSISNSSWYSDYSYFPDSNIFFIRGGNCNIGSSAGMFAFYGYYDNDYNDTYSDNTFRVVVPAL